MKSATETRQAKNLAKTPTGISGLDELTFGGLPTGRPTLLCGSAGCGKTLFSMTFLVNGVTRYGEPGVFMSFEERGEELATNVASLGFDIPTLIAEKKLAIDYVRIERNEIEETGEYDLEGLFVRLNHMIESIGAKRVVLDTIEALFSGFSDTAILRAELRRLFAWLRDKGVTAIITGERGSGQLTRHGIEEYVSDCVILLDNRVEEQITTRRLRVVKYRGSEHGTNEYPFLIDEKGINVMPITSAGLNHPTSSEAVPTGVPGLDAMLGIGGYFRGSSVLISGLAGTGKSTLAASFVAAACSRNERCLYFAFEESPQQIMRNLQSVDIQLKAHAERGLLRFEAARPSLYGFEMHLARMHRDIEEFNPRHVVVDPISAFRGPDDEIHQTLIRLADICKTRGVTAIFTSLSDARRQLSHGERGISSLMDTWISLEDTEYDGERNRIIYLLKSRGMNHSNQLREFRLTPHGIQLVDAYIGPAGVMTGSARIAQENREKQASEARERQTSQRIRGMERRRAAIARQIAELEASLADEEAEVAMLIDQDRQHEVSIGSARSAMATSRGVKS